MKRIIAILLLLCLLLPIKAQKREVRAVWLTTIGGLDWPHSYAQSGSSAKKQQQELCYILDKLQKAGVNTVLLQTRVRATTIYPSIYEPWDGCLSGFPGKGPGYDALQFAIDECHKRGMELHTWVVTIPVGKWNKTGCQRLRQRFPNLIKKIGDEGYMDPENPQTAEYLSQICREIADKYDIDGMHLDYIRYPETWKIRVGADQARRNITRIVEAIHKAVKGSKPWVKMSCSPVGKASDITRYWSHGWNSRDIVMQDAQQWMKDGLMDQLYPMMYFKGNNFYPFAIDWQEQSNGRMIVPGLGIYFMSPKEKNWSLEDITREMQMLRQYGMGHAYFRSKFFTDNTKGIYDFARKDFDTHLALVPPMTWDDDKAPYAPTDVKIDNGTFSWRKERGLTYNIYSSRTWPVDINNEKNLVLIRQEIDKINIPDNDDLYYAVTAMDRYGNESPATQSHQHEGIQRKLLRITGNYVVIPEAFLKSEGLIIIASVEGNFLKTVRPRGKYVDISGLKSGIYQLRTLNRRSISHNIGLFQIPLK